MSAGSRIWVAHALGRYPVDVAAGGLASLPALLADLAPARRPVVITDRNVARAVELPIKVPTLVVPPGEGSKTRTRWRALTDRMLDLGFGRDTVVVAVGGGVVGDLAGFVASTYLRGVPHVAVPTSLLAMVDASIGGKTGVNTRHGKNLVGAFHPPIAVLADPATLATLRSAHLRSGLVEAVKHGLAADPAYFDWIDESREALLGRDPDALTRLVERSVQIKGEIVSADEREAGTRAVLNLGHTVGHAIETVSGYRVSHGEAVATGLVVEAGLAALLGLAPPSLAPLLADRFTGLGLRLGLPAPADDEALLAAMRHDKKAERGGLRFTLPREPGGGPGETTPVAEGDVRQALGIARDFFDD